MLSNITMIIATALSWSGHPLATAAAMERGHCIGARREFAQRAGDHDRLAIGFLSKYNEHRKQVINEQQAKIKARRKEKREMKGDCAFCVFVLLISKCTVN